MTMYLIATAAAFLMGYFAHEPIAYVLAKARGKTRVVAFRGPRSGKDAPTQSA